MRYSFAQEPAGTHCDDRIGIFDLGEALVVVVADGAGGQSGGGLAADMACAAIRDVAARRAITSAEICRALVEADNAIRMHPDAGLTTACALAICDGMVAGASVGDSEAWLLSPDGVDVLTASERRKPLLGDSGTPVELGVRATGRTLVVGSDGLFKYVPLHRISAIALGSDADRARALIDAARTRRGTLQDDTTVVVVDV